MTLYAPKHQPWHDTLPGNEHGCMCDPAWKDRGMVMSGCYYHEMIADVEDLRDAGWLVVKVDGPVYQKVQVDGGDDLLAVVDIIIALGALKEIGEDSTP